MPSLMSETTQIKMATTPTLPWNSLYQFNSVSPTDTEVNFSCKNIYKTDFVYLSETMLNETGFPGLTKMAPI